MSNLSVRTITGKDNEPVLFPTGIAIGNGSSGGINDIGIAGQVGFGVGVCPGPLPANFVALPGCTDPMSDNYGNYQFSDGSIMVWIPAFYYKYGAVTNNSIEIKPFSAYTTVAEANTAGFALHRAFYDGGGVQSGVFVDKYQCSNNGGTASSIKNGIVITSAVRGSLTTATFASCTNNAQSPSPDSAGAFAVAKSRGADFFPNNRFIFAALALLSYAHGQASTSSTYCAWWGTNGAFPFPKGNNVDGGLTDFNDNNNTGGNLLYLSDGNGSYSCALTGSANLFSRTTHNGQNSGIADLNGNVWEVSPGLTSNGTHLFVLKTDTRSTATPANRLRWKDFTATVNGAGGDTDIFKSANFAALYDSLGETYESLTKANGWVLTGSSAPVFSGATSVSDNLWKLTGLGIPLTGGTGGTVAAFGQDGVYQPAAWPNLMCPVSGGHWSFTSGAGVWTLHCDSSASHSSNGVGARCAMYL